jgi:hypothetical protein
MAIYDKNGNILSVCYDKNGNPLNVAYDKDGNVVFTSDTFRVCTYNTGQFYIGNGSPIPTESKSIYTDLQTRIFSDITPDICIMQETTTKFCQDGTLADTFLATWFDNFQTTRGGSGYQAHKVATNGITIEDYTEIPFINAVGNYPGYETFYITVKGKRIFCVNTHMSTNQTYQEAQCTEILNAVEGKEYFIVCGDFNTVIASKTDTDYVNCIKPFIDKGYKDANCGSFGIFPTYYGTADPNASYRPATDHIIVSANIDIVNAFVNTLKLTDDINEKIDHMPLVADLIIN